MSRVCSNCAEGRPSAVTAVHLSGHVTGVLLPLRMIIPIHTYIQLKGCIRRVAGMAYRQIIGSIVKVWPTENGSLQYVSHRIIQSPLTYFHDTATIRVLVVENIRISVKHATQPAHHIHKYIHTYIHTYMMKRYEHEIGQKRTRDRRIPSQTNTL